jgi:hypothetical protein
MIISGAYPVTWGNPTLQGGYLVQSYDADFECKLTPVLEDEQGVGVVKIWNDNYSGLSLSVALTTGTPPLPGTQISYSGYHWFVDSASQKGTNKTYPMCDIKAFRSQGIGPFN